MPKQTFFNLPEDKKDMLLHALEKEFSRVPLFDASISNIVKEANIPRGSFYQYFEDKEDAYFYLLSIQVEQKKTIFRQVLEEENGDLFQAMSRITELTIVELAKGESLLFLKNAFLNMTHEIENMFNRIFNGNGTAEQFKEISCRIDKQNLNIKSDIELYHVMQLLGMVTFRCVINKLAKNIPLEQALESYHLEMQLLKQGLYKETK